MGQRDSTRGIRGGRRIAASARRPALSAEGRAMSRERLPYRRASVIFEVEAFDLPFMVSASKYSDGRLAEIFVTNHRAGSAAGIMASDAAIAASRALQFGCPVEVLRKALSRDSTGRASSPLGVALDLLLGDGK